MRIDAASVLGIAAAAIFIAALPAHADPLSIAACDKLKADLLDLDTAETARVLEQGPDWAKENLDRAGLDRVHRYILVEETVRFRCPERQIISGPTPPLPVASPHRAQKLKQAEVLAKEKEVADAKRAAELKAEEEKRAEDAKLAAERAAAEAASASRSAATEAPSPVVDSEPAAGQPPFAAAPKPPVDSAGAATPVGLLSDMPEQGSVSEPDDDSAADIGAPIKQPAPQNIVKSPRRPDAVPVQAKRVDLSKRKQAPAETDSGGFFSFSLRPSLP